MTGARLRALYAARVDAALALAQDVGPWAGLVRPEPALAAFAPGTILERVRAAIGAELRDAALAALRAAGLTYPTDTLAEWQRLEAAVAAATDEEALVWFAAGDHAFGRPKAGWGSLDLPDERAAEPDRVALRVILGVAERPVRPVRQLTYALALAAVTAESDLGRADHYASVLDAGLLSTADGRDLRVLAAGAAGWDGLADDADEEGDRPRRRGPPLAVGLPTTAWARLLGWRHGVATAPPGDERRRQLEGLRREWLRLGEEAGVIPRTTGGRRLDVPDEVLRELYRCGLALARRVRDADLAAWRDALRALDAEVTDDELATLEVAGLLTVDEVVVLRAPLRDGASLGAPAVRVLAARLGVPALHLPERLDLQESVRIGLGN